MQNFHGVYFTDVLKEMCSRVGVEYADVDFSQDNWYQKHTWTRIEENKFIEWYAQFLRSMGPRREMCKYPSLVRSKPDRLKFAAKMVAEFGWKVL